MSTNPTCIKKLTRVKNYFKHKQEIKRKCVASLIRCHGPNDPRPFIKIKIYSQVFDALLDSGASISVLGKGSLEFIKDAGLKMHRLDSHITTADGTEVQIAGYINLPVTIESKTESILFSVVPDLKEKIYLGIDFWCKFGIFPSLVINEISSSLNEDKKMHILSDRENEELDLVKNMFPSFIKTGLGRTSMHEHEIEILPNERPIKQRYYSVSSAVQNEMCGYVWMHGK